MGVVRLICSLDSRFVLIVAPDGMQFLELQVPWVLK